MAQHAYKEAFKAYNDGALSACVLHCRTALQADPRVRDRIPRLLCLPDRIFVMYSCL